MLTDAGFIDANLHGWTGFRTSAFTQGGLVTARKSLAGQVAPAPAIGEPPRVSAPNVLNRNRESRSRWPDSNRRPADYEGLADDEE